MKLAKAIQGKTEEEIAAILRDAEPADVAHLVYQLATAEPHFSAATVARLRDLHVETVVRLCKSGVIHPVHYFMKRYRIPLSAIRRFDETTLVTHAA